MRQRLTLCRPIDGFMPGTFQAVHNGTKAFLDGFIRLLHELKNRASACMSHARAIETDFFDRADMLDESGTAGGGRPAQGRKPLIITAGWQSLPFRRGARAVSDPITSTIDVTLESLPSPISPSGWN